MVVDFGAGDIQVSSASVRRAGNVGLVTVVLKSNSPDADVEVKRGKGVGTILLRDENSWHDRPTKITVKGETDEEHAWLSDKKFICHASRGRNVFIYLVPRTASFKNKQAS